jgi:hypothetical protein
MQPIDPSETSNPPQKAEPQQRRAYAYFSPVKIRLRVLPISPSGLAPSEKPGRADYRP